MPQPIVQGIRAILNEHGRLAVDASTLGEETNLYEAGLSSHASVTVMLALEERFDISVPEEDLEDVATVSQAVDLVMAKVAAKA